MAKCTAQHSSRAKHPHRSRGAVSSSVGPLGVNASSVVLQSRPASRLQPLLKSTNEPASELRGQTRNSRRQTIRRGAPNLCLGCIQNRSVSRRISPLGPVAERQKQRTSSPLSAVGSQAVEGFGRKEPLSPPLNPSIHDAETLRDFRSDLVLRGSPFRACSYGTPGERDSPSEAPPQQTPAIPVRQIENAAEGLSAASPENLRLSCFRNQTSNSGGWI